MSAFKPPLLPPFHCPYLLHIFFPYSPLQSHCIPHHISPLPMDSLTIFHVCITFCAFGWTPRGFFSSSPSSILSSLCLVGCTLTEFAYSLLFLQHRIPKGLRPVKLLPTSCLYQCSDGSSGCCCLHVAVHTLLESFYPVYARPQQCWTTLNSTHALYPTFSPS